MNCPNSCTKYQKPIEMIYAESIKVFSCPKCGRVINEEDRWEKVVRKMERDDRFN